MTDPRTCKRGPSMWAVNNKMKEARRMYAAGNYRRSAKLMAEAFHMVEQIKAYETKQYIDRITPVVEAMEGMNELGKELVAKKREGDSWH